MTDIAQLGFAIDSRAAVSATANLDKMAGAAGRAQSGTERMAARMQRDLSQVNSVIRTTAGLLAGFFSIQAATRFAASLARVADECTSVQSKLRLVTGGTEQLAHASADVYAISQRTFTSLDATATLASRTTRALVSNGADASEAMQKSLLLTEAVNNAFRVSGATSAESSNAIRQLSQGIAAGALRGEEYNSVAEQGARITQALAEYLGVTSDELRKMAADGKLTADVVTNALLASFEKLSAEAATMRITIGDALVQLDNAWTMLIGTLDQASQGSAGVAGSIQSIAQAIEILQPHLAALAKSWANDSAETDSATNSSMKLAESMKAVVTGIVLAKNVIDVLIDGFKAMVRIGISAGVELIGVFGDLVDSVPKLIEAFKNPGNIGDNLSQYVGEMLDKAGNRFDRFIDEAGDAGGDFKKAFTENISDAADAFEFLNAPLKEIPRATRPAVTAVNSLGIAVGKTAEEQEKLESALRRFEDLLGRINGAIDPVTAVEEKYNKIKRDGLALAELAVKLGGDEVKIRGALAAALGAAADNRDRDIKAIKQQQGAVDDFLRDLEAEAELIGMSEAERRRHITAMQAEEEMRRAILVAQEAGRSYSEMEIADLIALARARAVANEDLAQMQAQLDSFAESLGGPISDALGDFAGEALFHFDDIGDAADDLVDNLTDSFKDAFKSIIAEAAKLHLINPMLNSIFGTNLQTGGGTLGQMMGGGGFNPFSGFSDNFGKPTGFTNAAGGVNWGNVGQFAGGAFGVYSAYQNGPGGLMGGAQGALSGASAGAVFGPTGAIVGAIIGGIAGLLGGSKDPQFRIGAEGHTTRPEDSMSSALGGFTYGSRGMDQANHELAAQVAAFDNQIAQIIGSDHIGAVTEALSDWNLDLKGNAITAEAVLGSRFREILEAFDQDTQAFVLNAGTLEQQVSALQEVLSRPMHIAAILDQFREASQLADMSEQERQIYAVNQQFDSANAALVQLGASTAEIEELEAFRAQALDRLVAAETGATEATEELAQAAAQLEDLMSSLGQSLVDERQALEQFGMSDIAVRRAEIASQTQEAYARAVELGAGATELMRIELIGVERAMVATALAGAEFSQQLDEWSFQDALIGMSEADQQLAQSNRIWQQRFDQAVEIFGEGSLEATQVMQLWGNETARIADAADDAARATENLGDALRKYTFDFDAARQTYESNEALLSEARIGVRGDGMTEKQRAIAEIYKRFQGYEDQLRRSLEGAAVSPAVMKQLEEQVNAGLIELASLRLEALTNLELEWQNEIEGANEERYKAELEWIRRLSEFQESLLLDSALSTLTPAEMLSEAERQYQDALAGAAMGDEASRAAFEDAARAYLEQARGFFSSGQQYSDIFGAVQGDIAGLIDASPVTQADGAYQQAISSAAIVESRDEIRGLREDGDEQTVAIVGRLSAVEGKQVQTVSVLANILAEVRRMNSTQGTRV